MQCSRKKDSNMVLHNFYWQFGSYEKNIHCSIVVPSYFVILVVVTTHYKFNVIPSKITQQHTGSIGVGT